MKKAKVLLTGITGFIGSHTAIHLLNHGYEVRGSMRNLQRADSIRSVIQEHTAQTENLEFVQAELLDMASWERAVEGVDYVLHMASPVPVALPKDENELIVPAREGTLNVLRAAQKAGVKRVVLTSSVAAIMYGQESKRFTEADWTNVQDRKDTTPYVRSKTIAEREAWNYVNGMADMELVSVNPALVLGPILEKDYGSSAELIKKTMDGSLPGLAKLGFCLVDVRDVADMHRRALEVPEAAGERFICAGEFYWQKEVAHILRETYPQYRKKIPKRIVPDFVIRLAGLFDKEVNGTLHELSKPRLLSNEKARSILGWEPRSEKEAILSCAESLIRFQVI
jgi:dihydroflavonol-4-reductase